MALEFFGGRIEGFKSVVDPYWQTERTTGFGEMSWLY